MAITFAAADAHRTILLSSASDSFGISALLDLHYRGHKWHKRGDGYIFDAFQGSFGVCSSFDTSF